MADKAFNEKPMITIIADSLDPRIKRQLQSQLQSELLTVSELDAEIKKQESIENIKQQYDSVEDASEFDDDKTNTPKTPEPVEAQPAKEGDDGGDDPFADDSDSKEEPKKEEEPPKEEPAKEEPVKEEPPKEEPVAPAGGAAASGGDGGDDPFSSDDGAIFESVLNSFNIIDGRKVKLEDSQISSTVKLPPMKQITYIRGTDSGVDNRTNMVIAALPDPQNTVVVLDLADALEVEAKIQFSSLKKSLQERGVLVVDSVDEAVDHINTVYDQLASGGKE